MKKNILIVYPTLPQYRNDFFCLLSQRLKQFNMDLIVLAGTNLGKKSISENENELPFKVIRNRRMGFSILNYQIQWAKDLIKNAHALKPYKVIFMYNAGILNNSLLMLYLFINRIPYIIWGSGHRRVGLSDKKYSVKMNIKSIFMKLADSHITYSNYYRNELIQMGFSESKVYCAQNTINTEKIFNNLKKIKTVKKENRKLNFLFVGALIPQKKLDTAIGCFKKLKEDGYDFTFDIIGNGEIYENLSETIKKNNLRHHVCLHGAKHGPDVAAFFMKADVFVLPGTGGLAINEAMAYGLPVIATPGDGTGFDLIKNGENGFLLDYDYHEIELYNSLKFFLDCDEEVRYIFGNKSYKRIKELATLQNMVDNFVHAILA